MATNGSLIWLALALGIVEGVTEFVPISSTGHLLLIGRWLEFPEDKAAPFSIFIQLGAVLAVLWFYRAKLLALAGAVRRDARVRAFLVKIGVAFLPAALAGLLLHRWIVQVLFAPVPIAAALAVGGALLVAIDRPGARQPAVESMEDVGFGQALLIGCVQVLALWPGMSRAGATIIGGLLAGLSRAAALEFSFFLAIPTLGAASVFALWEARDTLAATDVALFAVGLAVSFVASLAAIAGLLRYVREHDLRAFGWYRLVLAAVILGTVWLAR